MPPRTPTTAPVGGFHPPVSPPPYVLSERWETHFPIPICPLCRFYENRSCSLRSWGLHLVLIEVAFSLSAAPNCNQWTGGRTAPLAPLRYGLPMCSTTRGGVLASSGLCPLRVCASPPRMISSMSAASVFYMFGGSLLRALAGSARLLAASCGRGPRPALVGSGGPRPFSPSPLPMVAPRRGGRGFGRAVSAYGGLFLSANAQFSQLNSVGLPN